MSRDSVAPLPGDASWRRGNLGHLLFAATGACVRDTLAILHRGGFTTVTGAHLALFQNLDATGTRLTVLAARAGLTKQSMIELIDKAERQVLVERRPDPGDRRAKIVCLTLRGRELVGVLDEGVAVAERRFETVIGETCARLLKRELIAYAAADPTAPTGADEFRRTDGIERALADAAQRFVRDVLATVHRHGYREVTEALLALFRNLDLEGSRLTDVAALARVTKPSIRALVSQAETLGLVERARDPVDGRAKTIRFTEAGLVMLAEMRRGIADAELRFTSVTHDAFLIELKARLRDYLSARRASAATH